MARFAQKHTSTFDPQVFDQNYEHGFSYNTDSYAYIAQPGLSKKIVQSISDQKQEPGWMLDLRLQALPIFQQAKLPTWGADLSGINFDTIRYYLRPTQAQAKSWDEVPPEVKETFDRLGVTKAEQQALAGVKAQYDSEVIYGSLHKTLQEQGVIFLSMDEAVAKYPDLVKSHFGKTIPAGDNKFAALNTAVWSGGSFVYVPKNVHVKMPLQTYFRINAANAGQFERTLIIVDEGASVHYVEGCTAPTFSSGSLHSAVVEIVVKKGARCQYTTIQNWYKNIYNLVTKRAYVEEEGEMIWTDFNMGSKVTMKYPSFILAGDGARGETLSMALAGAGQHQDTGSKAIHLGKHTSSAIISKSISKDGGQASYRGLISVGPNADYATNTVVCDALILDPQSRTDTYPTQRVFNSSAQLSHEATVSKIGEEQLFYLMSRGVDEATARKMIVRGFIDGLVRQLPLEYAIEMNRLIDYEMEGSVG